MKKAISLCITIIFLISMTACGNDQDIQNVENLISSIGIISNESSEVIAEAEEAYAALSENQKEEVSNYDVLSQAREAYNTYLDALSYIDEMNYIEATDLLISLSDLCETESLLNEIEQSIVESQDILSAWDFFELTGQRGSIARIPSLIACCWQSVVLGLCSDGTVLNTGGTINDQEIAQLINVKQIDVASNNIIALWDDGTLDIIGPSEDDLKLDDEDITMVSTNSDNGNLVALKSDGTVLTSGVLFENNEISCADWTGIIQISLGGENVLGLKEDGTVLTAGENDYGQCDIEDWDDIVSISTSVRHSVGLKADGTVVAAGDNEYGQCNVDTWTDIVAVSAAMTYTVGLKSDGTVVAVGDNEYGQCDVDEWSDIISISADDDRTFGVLSDGSVVATGLETSIFGNSTGLSEATQWNLNDNNQSEINDDSASQEIPENVGIFAGYFVSAAIMDDGSIELTGYSYNTASTWDNIKSIAFGTDHHLLGLYEDGKVIAINGSEEGEGNVSEWEDIIAVAAGTYHSVGLKSDGTVLSVGNNDYGQCNTSDWNNIVDIAAGCYFTVGLKSDGTVVAVGDDNYGQCDVSNWTDIVAIAAGYFHTIGLKADGTVVATGSNEDGKCDVSQWSDIISIAGGLYNTIGLKSDGTVVITGGNKYDQYDVLGWTDIVAIASGSSHILGLTADGNVVAAGDNRRDQCEVADWKLW